MCVEGNDRKNLVNLYLMFTVFMAKGASRQGQVEGWKPGRVKIANAKGGDEQGGCSTNDLYEKSPPR